jgi:PAS domain S-box-containing protein
VGPTITDLSRLIASPTLLLAGAALVGLGLLALVLLQMRARRRAERTATAVRSELRTVTATMREGVIAYDSEQRMLFVNAAFERLTGFPEEDLRDQEFLQFVHPDDRPALLGEWDRLAQGESLRDQEYRVITRGGAVRWCAGDWEPLRDEAGRQTGVLGTEFDITERKLAEDAMRDDAELLQAVIEVQQAVAAAGLDSATVMRVIVERSRELTGAGGACIEVIEGDELVPKVYLGIDPPRLALATSLSGLSVKTGELQRSDDTFADPRIGHTEYRKRNVHSLLVVPLKDEQRIVGILKVVSTEPHAFSDRDAKALRLLAGLAGASLGHAAIFESRQVRLEERTRALQDSEQRFKQLVDVAQEGIWVADERGVITYVNQRMAELLGYQNGAMLGRPVYEFVDAGSRSNAQRVLSRPSGTQGENHDLRFRRQDGSELWGLVSASPILGRDGGTIGSVGMVTDITTRKRTEDRLRRSAERLAVLHDMDQAILAARSPAEIGRVALGRMRRMVTCQRCSVILFDFGRGVAEMLAGYADGMPLKTAPLPLATFSPAEVLRHGSTRYLEDLATLEARPSMLQDLFEEGMRSVLSVPLLVDGEAIGEVNLASTTPQGFDPEHREIAQEIATPLAIAIQQARLREELGRQTAELERRMAERGAALRAATAELETLLYSVAHDVRDPLRHICGFTQLLLEDAGPASDPAVRHYAERIGEAAQRMTSLVDDLVTLSRVGRQDLMRRPVDFGFLVEDLAGRLQAETPGREIEWRVDPLPELDCDASLARTALEELLSNAVKFTRGREPAVIQVRAVEADGQAGVAVQDNGVGFSMAHAGKLFGVFQRLHGQEEFEGNGAGLALVQRIAHKHGGRVWAEGEPGQGATFYITFGGPRA